MPRVKLPKRSCDSCHHLYEPDPLNAHHQKYCRRPGCLRRRKLERQRRWYRKLYRNDAGFRDRERRRARLGKDRRREEAPSVRPPEPDQRDLALIGLVAHMADTRDPEVAREAMALYVGRGRELAGGAAARAPPAF